MSQSFDTLLYEVDDSGVATVTVNRPNKLNALNDHLLDELSEVFKIIHGDEEVTAVIITGAGEKAFVAGADIKEISELDQNSGATFSQKGQEVFQSIEDTRKPVLAAVNGYALGGGAELAMACHIRIAGAKAVFGLPEVGLGLIPGYGGTQRLPAIVGKSKASELILTGKQIDAQEAYRIGLVNNVVDDNDPTDEARKIVSKILKNGPVAVRQALEAIGRAGDASGFEAESDLFGQLCDTDDFKEGTQAFLEKRKPDFRGK